MTRPLSRRRFAPIAPLLALTCLAAAPAQAPVPTTAASDEATLLALHAKVLQAHRESSVEMLLDGAVTDFVQANRGAITRPTLEERRTRFADYLGRTTFREYRDVVEPVVRVSKDGSLGWVIAQVQAKGEQTTSTGAKEALEFTSAWIELYEKRDGRWVSIGNLSNFK